MAIEIVLIDKGPNEIMEIVKELRANGLVQGVDFDFAFHQAKWDNFSYEAVVNKHTVFTFYTEKHSTFFALKYS